MTERAATYLVFYPAGVLGILMILYGLVQWRKSIPQQTYRRISEGVVAVGMGAFTILTVLWLSMWIV
jgi:hypothetical protein